MFSVKNNDTGEISWKNPTVAILTKYVEDQAKAVKAKAEKQ
jgi:hypothetical protein